MTISGDVMGQVVDNPVGLSAADNNTFKISRQIGAGAEMTLFDGYRRNNLVYRNAVRLDSSIFGLVDAAETMSLNAVEVYLDVARLGRLLRLAQRNLARHREIGAQIMEQVDGGMLPTSDGFTVRDRIVAARSTLLSVEQSLADARARYLRVIGREPVGEMSVPSVRDLPKSLAAFVDEAVAASFQVRAATARISETEYEGRIATSDHLPRVTLNAGVTHGVDRDGSRGTKTDTFVGMKFNWVIHKGGRANQRAALNARTMEAVYKREDAVRQARELATRTWNGYLRNIEDSRLYSQQLSVNRTIATLYLDEVEAAKKTLMDVLAAERTVFDVEFQKVSAEASLTFSGYRMLALRGRLAAHFGLPQSRRVIDLPDRPQDAPRPGEVFNSAIPMLR